MLRQLLSAIALLWISSMGFAQGEAAKSLVSPFYVPPRSSANHIALESWELSYRDQAVNSTLELLDTKNWIPASRPGSVQATLALAGELPDPYVGLNSEKYLWVDEKVWYYRKIFRVPASDGGNRLMLCFDGIDYFSRVWINGELAGEHEGMLGGPYIDATKLIQPGRENEVIVEVRAANWGRKESYEATKPGNVIKPWVSGGGSGAEMFFPLGMWRGARLEILPFTHIERPFLRTTSANASEAKLLLDVELAVNPGESAYHLYEGNPVRMREFLDTAETPRIQEPAEVRVRIYPQGQPQELLVETIPVELWNGRTRVSRELTVLSPQLWWPNGLGPQPLYTVELELVVDSQLVDSLTLSFGIRHLETVPSAGPATQDVWNDWQFRVNGKPFFVKGINWMPADILLDLPPSRYEWLVEMAKAAGVTMFRVWGGGLVETDTFYDLCDKHGILVWQDFPMSNMLVPEWPHDVWEAQVASSVYRLRNHPSLAVWCGGNEANPYVKENTAATGIFERWVRELDGTRAIRRSSPDGGSVHEYPDMDPSWYGKRYQLVPFMAETGMHNIPSPNTMREVVNPSEFEKPLSGLYNENLGKDRPELRHHFVEFAPARVPRMLSRASHMADMSAPTIEALAEASQIGAGEFYQVLSERMQAQYPITTGLLPWVYNRPWPVIAIQTVDGFGHPTAPYYFLKRSYSPTRVVLQLPWLLWAPGEEIPLDVDILSQAGTEPFSGVVHARVLGSEFETLHEAKGAVNFAGDIGVHRYQLGSWKIPESLGGKFFFVLAELKDTQGRLVSRAVYWPRCPELLADESRRTEYRSQPNPWPTLEKGPWLKPQVARNRTTLTGSVIRRPSAPEGRGKYIVRVENKGGTPAVNTTIEITGRKNSFYATDNYFWLAAGESREIEVNALWREDAGTPTISLSAWNADAVTLR